jgi:hypothetical protein
MRANHCASLLKWNLGTRINKGAKARKEREEKGETVQGDW